MMKKIIALALALSMALSMVAFAGYTDADKIDTDLSADVELVGALGIMQGNTDGTFNPTGNLTRAEAAVIIYRLHSGKSTIDSSWGDKTLSTFTDMDHWSAPYVNYCAALGLISGYTDKSFRPENNVTVAEMAKMLLNVLGYNTEKQGYGNNWPMVVLADATTSGLLNDYDQAFTGAATREWVAKMLTNMLKANVVGYSAVTDALSVDTDKTFGDKYGVETQSVTVAATEKVVFNAADEANEDTTRVLFGEKDICIDSVVDVSLLGMTATVYYKDTEATAGNAGLSAGDKIYAVINATDTVTVAADKIHFASSYLYLNGSKTTTKKADLNVAYASLAEKANFLEALKNTTSSSKLADTREVTFADLDGDGKYDAVFTNLVNYGIVDTLDVDDETAILVDADGDQIYKVVEDDYDVKWEMLNFVDEIEEDDVVRYESTYTNDGLQIVISKLIPVTTTLTTKSGSSFTVSGTTYKEAATTMEAWDYAEDFLDNVDSTTLEETVYDLYTDGKYVIYAKTNTGAAVTGLNMNLALVIDKNVPAGTGAFAESAKVQVILANGDIAIYEYSAEDDDVSFDDATKDKLYNYVLNDDATITFTSLASKADHGDNAEVIEDAPAASYTRKTSVSKSFLADSNDTYYANAESILFVKHYVDGDLTYSVVKASELKGSLSKDNYNITTVGYTSSSTTGLNTLVYAVAITNGDLPTASAKTGDWFLAIDTADKTLVAGGAYWTVKGINAAGEAETLTITKNGDDVDAGTLYNIKTQGDDTWLVAVELVEDLTEGWNSAVVTAATNEVVMINNELVDVADGAVIVYLYNDDGDIALKDEDLPSNLPYSKDGTAIAIEMNDDGDVVSMIITVTEDANTVVESLVDQLTIE